MRKVIHRELCKRLEFGPAYEGYMRKRDSVQVNEKHRVLWDFGIHADQPIQARRLLINKMKRTCRLIDFALPIGIKENVEMNKLLDLFI